MVIGSAHPPLIVRARYKLPLRSHQRHVTGLPYRDPHLVSARG